MKHFSEISASAERVVDAAEGLIQQHGYNGFSYDDVSRIVGIKKPSIHHHFPTKGELVSIVAQRYTHRFRERLLHIEGLHAKADERLLAYAALFEATYVANQRLCVCGMLGAEVNSLPDDVVDEVRRFFEVNIEWLATVIAAGQQAGQLRVGMGARSMAEAYLCTLEGAMVVGRGMHSNNGPAKAGQTFLFVMLD